MSESATAPAAIAVVGVDLAGPSNVADTALASFSSAGEAQHESGLRLTGWRTHATDATLLRVVEELLGAAGATATVVVGLDAPLSYNPGGGDRAPDEALRQRLCAAGLPSGCVMPPTMTRMAYLTLRGVVVARLLGQALGDRVRIVEVHPTGAMALRGAPVAALVEMKRSLAARREIADWLRGAGVHGLEAVLDPSHHLLAACAAALAAADWAAGRPAWLAPASPPHHPFDFAC
jgi:predicted nuclease with RNAse H fold